MITNKRQKSSTPPTPNHTTAMWKQGKAPIVPVTVLTGFLGSGKTTLLNHILNDTSHQMKFAVIENEFGEVGIDEHVLSENVDEEVIEVINGCICCTVRGDLVVALKKLYNKVSTFNGIIIETTGLADPAPVIQTFFVDEDVRKMYKLDSVITVVDANNIIQRLDEKKPEGVENESVEQVVFADKIILNKVDLLSPSADGTSSDKMDKAQAIAEIEARLHKINTTAPILHTSFCKISPKELLNVGAFDLQRVLEFEPEFLDDPDQEHQHDSSVVSTSTKLEGDMHIEMLTQWIQRLISEDGANLYRYKGVMAVKGKKEKFVFQGVGMLFAGSFEGSWKAGEKRQSRFVFIGKNLDVEFLKIGFKACLVSDEPPRFAIGTPVYANCGEWRKGKVIKHWDDGNTYRVRLEGSDQEVWAPLDIEQYIKSV